MNGRPRTPPNERLFRLGAAVAEALWRGGSIEALARYFEYWLLRLEGVYPALDVCPRCGEARLQQGAVLGAGGPVVRLPSVRPAARVVD